MGRVISRSPTGEGDCRLIGRGQCGSVVISPARKTDTKAKPRLGAGHRIPGFRVEPDARFDSAYAWIRIGVFKPVGPKVMPVTDYLVLRFF